MSAKDERVRKRACVQEWLTSEWLGSLAQDTLALLEDAEAQIIERNEELGQLKQAVGLLFTAYLRAERDDDEIERAVRRLLDMLGWPAPRLRDWLPTEVRRFGK